MICEEKKKKQKRGRGDFQIEPWNVILIKQARK